MSGVVKIENASYPVARVQLNRPEKKNAFNAEMFDALVDAAATLKAEPGLRAVVMSGAGDCFCAGLDVAMFLEFAQDLDGLKTEMLNPPKGAAANRFQAPVVCWQALPVPVIAAVTGVCFGAGMQLALAADFRFAAPDARFSIMESKWGLIPDMGITQSLPKLLPADRAMELIMTARIIGSDEALSLGLITRIVDHPVVAANEFADELATRSPDAIKAAKALIHGGWNAPVVDALALEASLQANLLGAPNQMEAVMANTQKRAPKFL